MTRAMRRRIDVNSSNTFGSVAVVSQVPAAEKPARSPAEFQAPMPQAEAQSPETVQMGVEVGGRKSKTRRRSGHRPLTDSAAAPSPDEAAAVDGEGDFMMGRARSPRPPNASLPVTASAMVEPLPPHAQARTPTVWDALRTAPCQDLCLDCDGAGVYAVLQLHSGYCHLHTISRTYNGVDFAHGLELAGESCLKPHVQVWQKVLLADSQIRNCWALTRPQPATLPPPLLAAPY